MRKECVRIVIILKEEVRNLGIVFMLIKQHYALVLCQNCYQMAYIKKNLESKSFKGDNTILNDKKNVFEKKEDNCVNNIKEKY